MKHNKITILFCKVIFLYIYFLNDQKHITSTQNRIDFESRAQLSSASKFISPIIDTARNSVITVENIIRLTP